MKKQARNTSRPVAGPGPQSPIVMQLAFSGNRKDERSHPVRPLRPSGLLRPLIVTVVFSSPFTGHFSLITEFSGQIAIDIAGHNLQNKSIREIGFLKGLLMPWNETGGMGHD